MQRKYKNKKTGKIYWAIAYGVNTTNNSLGQLLVIYHPDDQENTIFAREVNEFAEKFEKVEEIK